MDSKDETIEITNDELYEELKALFQNLFANQLTQQISTLQTTLEEQEESCKKLDSNVTGIGSSLMRIGRKVEKLDSETQDKLEYHQEQITSYIKSSHQKQMKKMEQEEKERKQVEVELFTKNDQMHLLYEQLGSQIEQFLQQSEAMNKIHTDQLDRSFRILMDRQNEAESKFSRIVEEQTQQQANNMEQSRKEICDLLCSKTEEALQQTREKSEQTVKRLWIGFGVLLASNLVTMLLMILR